METRSFSDDLQRYLALLWHWAWLLVLAAALAGGVAFLVSKQMSPVYQASTTVLINEAPATRSNDYSSVLTSERLTQTYSQLLTKQPALQGVIERLALDITVDDLAQQINVQPVRDTQLIEVRVEDTDKTRAVLIANALVAEFDEQNQALQTSRYASIKQSLETQLAEVDLQIQQTSQAMVALGQDLSAQAERERLDAIQAQYRQTYAYLLQSYESVRLAEAQSTSNVVQVEPATALEAPVRPRVMTNTVLAVVVGLMLAVGVVFLIEALDDTIRGPEEIARQLGLPVLGVIGHMPAQGEGLMTVTQPRSPISEAFRALRTNIQFASVDTPVRKLLVTSPSPSDGKSTVVANLGAVLAQNGQRVVLIDADLRRPRLHKVMRLPNRRGVSELFVQPQLILDGAAQKTETPNLFTVTSGSLPPNPSELLGSSKMVEILKTAEQDANMIILDTPPVLAVTDAVVLAPRVDGVLLVVKPGATKMAAARQSANQLRQVGAKLLGVVLNDVEIKRSRYYYYHYQGYYYTYYDNYGGENDNGSRQKVKRQVPKVRV
jgi:non-specific protein-tyrosine kinase